jgi:predicted ATPase
MQGEKLLHSIRLKNLLSYGSEGVSLDLEPLNVLIGPNGSGKSNLIEAISLLAAAPRDLLEPLREGGGAAEWIWKGSERTGAASLEVLITYPDRPRDRVLRYGLSFEAPMSRFNLTDEFIRFEKYADGGPLRPHLNVNYEYGRGKPKALTRIVSEDGRTSEMVMRSLEKVNTEQSILSQLRGADIYPELTYLGERFSEVAFFRESNMGRLAVSRLPQRIDLSDGFLLEDASNLGLVLNNLLNRRATKQALLKNLQQFYEGVKDITTKVIDRTIQVLVYEIGIEEAIPASRLSDGTLHYLCLLTILLHPEPPPLICIEEPELGLHPDILPKVADLLIDASQRTQLIVTTHSETLVSRLSEIPESVVVCERDEQGTHLRRLEPEKLRAWLDKYMLGELWRMGEIGGNRW